MLAKYSLFILFLVAKSVTGNIENEVNQYKKMFILKRVQQREEIKKIIQADSYSRRYDLIKALHHQIFETLMEAHTTLDRANYEVKPITQFPEDHKLKESVSLVLENTMFLAESVVHFPNISRELFLTKYKVLCQLAVNFARRSQLLSQPDLKLIDVMMREYALEKPEPGFTNPYIILPPSPTAPSSPTKDSKKRRHKTGTTKKPASKPSWKYFSDEEL